MRKHDCRARDARATIRASGTKQVISGRFPGLKETHNQNSSTSVLCRTVMNTAGEGNNRDVGPRCQGQGAQETRHGSAVGIASF